MRIVVDNNLWISFLIGKKLALLQRILLDSNITVFICDELIHEFKDVSQRGKIRKYIGEKDIWDALHIIETFCKFVQITKKASSPVRDAKDLYLLSLSETVQADYIITGDKDLLVLKKHGNTVIVNFTEFLRFISN